VDHLRSRRAAVQRQVQEKRLALEQAMALASLEPPSVVPAPVAQAAEWVVQEPVASPAAAAATTREDELGSIEQRMADFEAAIARYRVRLAQPSLSRSFRTSLEGSVRMLEQLLAILGMRRQGLIRRCFASAV
jgi:hypothetical protein